MKKNIYSFLFTILILLCSQNGYCQQSTQDFFENLKRHVETLRQKSVNSTRSGMTTFHSPVGTLWDPILIMSGKAAYTINWNSEDHLNYKPEGIVLANEALVLEDLSGTLNVKLNAKYTNTSAFLAIWSLDLETGNSTLNKIENWGGILIPYTLLFIAPLKKAYESEFDNLKPNNIEGASELWEKAVVRNNEKIDITIEAEEYTFNPAVTYTYDLAGNRISRTLKVATRTLMTYEEPEKIITEEIAKRDVKIYSSIKGQITVEFSTLEGMKNGKMHIYSFPNGQSILNRKVNSLREDLDISSKPSGIYFLIVDIDGKKTTYKLMK